MTDFPIVGVGCSAGGLEPLRALFQSMPREPGMAFVVINHLDPTKESQMAELLGNCTEMPVTQISEAVQVEPNSVYIIAPDQELVIDKGVLLPRKPQAERGHRHPVDTFLRALAEDQGLRAIAIILSGTGSNGSTGLRFIKAEGGIVIVQEPETAKFTGMPRSAIGTGNADLVLAPEKMGEALVGMAGQEHVRQPAKVIEQKEPREELRSVLSLVRVRTGKDFSGYKNSTLLRRILRRMGLHRIPTITEYLDRLRTDEEELNALLGDLTINVTGFFRDPEAWETLKKKVVEPMVQERRNGGTVRVWVPGCSTGEEAYSIAMLFTEAADKAGKRFDLRLFATDVDERVLPVARAGRYPGSIALDVREDRLGRFFDQEDDTWVVRRQLREMITFAPQNLLQDPPFSRQDLVSCRNLLIYLEPRLQKRVLGLLHFAVREGGFLFLGPAETVGPAEGLFEPISKKWRIYQRIGPTRHDIFDFPLETPSHHAASGENVPPERVQETFRAGEALDRALLERYAPASVLIDHRFIVQYSRGTTDEYLRPPTGEPSYNLISMAREGLQAPLRNALRKATDQRKEVSARAHVWRNWSMHPVRFTVTPLPKPRSMLMVTFSELETAAHKSAEPQPEAEADQSELQAELDSTREDLRRTIEEMEAANEELKASNEEIRSMNEELQASNEELETSKEELQSLNEELNTVNSQLQSKVDELEESTADLNNLLEATHVASLFLDRDLCVRWFTPAMKDLFDLRQSDMGRPISHFAPKFHDSNFVKDAETVLRKLTPVNAEVSTDGGWTYLRQITPYQGREGRIGGVVVTFMDISERKEWENALEAQRLYAEQIVETVREPLLVLNPDLTVRSANKSFYATFQVAPEETEGRAVYDIGQRQWDIPELRRLLEEILPANIEFNDFEVEHDFPEIGRRSMLLNGRQIDHVELILVAIEDITGRREAERERELLTRELSHRVKNTLAVVQSLAVQTDGNIGSVEQYRDVFLGRLQAMAQAHGLLLQDKWRGASVDDVVREALAPFRLERLELVEIEGEPVSLKPKQTLALSLILHELSTNAAKYGALSEPQGRVRVSWEVRFDEGAGKIRLLWQEQGGPKATAPEQKGFGTQLIEQASDYELHGEAHLDFAYEGLVCTIEFPLEAE